MEVWLRLGLAERSASFADAFTAARGEAKSIEEHHARISRHAL